MGRNANGKPSGCVTTSSDCVIWNGPDISFLDLCTGDTVSTVVAGIADKICNLIKITSVGSYDYSCIDEKECSPKNFIDLFQLVLDVVCEIKNPAPTTNSTTVGGTAGCPDCEMSIASCFQENGNTVLQLKDYIAAIGVKVCNQQSIINTQSAAITAMQQDLTLMQTTINEILQK